jgi:ubiquinone/menaquinone biosynthesis C-methylase UbiE
MTDSRRTQLNRVAGIYDDLAPTWDQRQGLVERLLMGSAIRKRLAGELAGDVLEIGSGTGATMRYVDFKDAAITSFTATDLSMGSGWRGRVRISCHFPMHRSMLSPVAWCCARSPIRSGRCGKCPVFASRMGSW